MHILHKGLILSCLPLLLVSAAAVGGLNGVDVVISNDSTDDVMVTVYDTSTHPNSMVLTSERINGFTRIPVELSLDETGRGNVAWTTVPMHLSAKMKDGKTIDTPVRYTGIWEKKGKTWLLVHEHLSAPLGG